ncbi:MAG: flagellar filament capping protein FliD [Planctomycetes bacterium]|nr:flagellar filament capping protein FliD [Planctomycetota bacterium]
MGTITTGIGLISGIDTATLIDSLIALEARGKLGLQARLVSLQAQKTALLDINARLLNFKNIARSFRLDSIFKSALASSSNSDILTATASARSLPGTFTFIVKQLVATSQKLSAGFADTDTTPLGLTSLSFEFGKGTLSTDTDLENLNGGAGVARGKIIIIDGIGTTTVDLTDVTSLNEVLDRINSSGANVTATVDGDHVVVTENDLGALEIKNAIGYTTATDLGIAATDGGDGIITGTDINTISGSTALRSLNDGNGVIIRNNVPDLHIKARDTTSVFDIDLGRVDAAIDDTTLLADLNNGSGIKISNDAPDFTIVTSEGVSVDINIGQIVDSNDDVTDEAVTTVGELKTRITSQLAAAGVTDIALAVTTDNRFTLTETTLGGGALQVIGAGPSNDQTAQDLGILGTDGGTGDTDGTQDGVITGTIIPNTVQTTAALTLQDVIDRINNALDTGGGANAGRIVASIATDGVSLLITDTIGGGGNLIIEGFSTDPNEPNAAADLGIFTGLAGVAASTVDGNRLIAGLNSVLVGNLNGGAGLSGNTTLTITDKAAGNDTFTIDELGSLNDIIDQINSSPNIQVTASLNSKGTGLLITDTSAGGGSLTIGGSAATELKINGTTTQNTIEGANLQLRYVSEASLLSDLNYGRGVGTGVFRITDGYGNVADVNIGSDSLTLFDIIQEINSRGLAVKARVNDNGDGLLLEHDPTNASPVETGEPFVAIKVETLSGTTAADLNILGEADAVGEDIEGSYERVVTLDVSDSLSDVVGKINDAGIPVSASIINIGSGATPFRLNFSSKITGRLGELIIDSGGVDLGLTTLSDGRDAKVFFGSDDPSQGFLITSSSNSISDVVPGVTIDLVSASDDPVTVTVTRDTQKIEDAVFQLVTTFNDAIGRINEYDFFDVDSEQRGPLLGNSTTARVRGALYRVVQGPARGVETQYQRLSQVGIRVGAEGVLTFDKDKFREAYENDPEAVENLFAAFKGSTTTEKEIADGVTVNVIEQEFTVLGLGDLFDQLLDGLTNSIDGTVTLADQVFQDQIDLTNKRIEAFDVRLEARRERLERQFLAMEKALAQLQAQNNALLSLAGNLALAQNLSIRR